MPGNRTGPQSAEVMRHGLDLYDREASHKSMIAMHNISHWLEWCKVPGLFLAAWVPYAVLAWTPPTFGG